MLEYKIGNVVRIKTGPFASFTGRVEEVFYETSTLKVAVDIFGRRTPVSLAFRDVERVNPGDGDQTHTSFPSNPNPN